MRKHQCEMCQHSEGLIMDLWKHKAIAHNVAYNEEILLYALTEQNYDLGVKVSSLELATRENTEEFKKLVGVVVKENQSVENVVESKTQPTVDNQKTSRKEKETNVVERKVLWAGTSLSTQHLDKDALEKKTNTKVDKLKVFTITREEGKKNKDLNAEELVCRALEGKQYDILVLEIGVNEISNLNIMVEKQVLRATMKNHMEKLFHLSLQYITDYPDMKVVLLNRLPRLDSVLRSDLSMWADKDMARLWEENGRLDNIILESLNLQVGSARDKEEVFGRQLGSNSYGIHFRGRAGNMEFTYRAARLLQRVIWCETNIAGTLDTRLKDRMEEKRKNVESKEEERKREQKRELEDRKKNDTESKRREQLRDEEKRRNEEKLRRLAAIKKREEDSKRRIQENARKKKMEQQKTKQREEAMRKSDERQEREEEERGREKQTWKEVGRRGRKGSWASAVAGRSHSDYEERKKARELRHREAEERENRMTRGERRKGSPARNDDLPRERRWVDRHYWEEGRYPEEDKSWGREDRYPSEAVREDRQYHGGREDRQYCGGREDRQYRGGREDRQYRGGREDRQYHGGREDGQYRGGREDRVSRGGNREACYTSEAVREDRQAHGWREDRHSRAGEREREGRQPRQERERRHHLSTEEVRTGNGRRGAPAPPAWA